MMPPNHHLITRGEDIGMATTERPILTEPPPQWLTDLVQGNAAKCRDLLPKIQRENDKLRR